MYSFNPWFYMDTELNKHCARHDNYARYFNHNKLTIFLEIFLIPYFFLIIQPLLQIFKIFVLTFIKPFFSIIKKKIRIVMLLPKLIFMNRLLDYEWPKMHQGYIFLLILVISSFFWVEGEGVKIPFHFPFFLLICTYHSLK